MPPEVLRPRKGGRPNQSIEIHETLDLNLIVPFRLSQLVFPHMIEVGRGSVVYISSMSGHVGVPGIPQASYAAAKLGLSGLTRELATQWARHSIRVNTIAPGFFRSEVTEPLYSSERGTAWLREEHTPSPPRRPGGLRLHHPMACQRRQHVCHGSDDHRGWRLDGQMMSHGPNATLDNRSRFGQPRVAAAEGRRFVCRSPRRWRAS